GIPVCPAVLTDERGNLVVYRTISESWAERLARAAAVEFGGAAARTGHPPPPGAGGGAPPRDTASGAGGRGGGVAGGGGRPRGAALITELGAFRLVTGKVLDVERHTTSGFVRGSVVIEGLEEDAGRLIRLEVQNENLVALERGRLLGSVPDLITVLDSETADAI